MKTARLILLVSVALLVVASLSGCLRRSQPQALFTVTLSEDVIPFTVNFNGTLSYTPVGEIVSYLWTFGDGGSETGPLVEHTYKEDGTYEAQLLVFDDRGVSSSTRMTIQALNPPPTARYSYTPKSNMEGNYIVSCSEEITFDASESVDNEEIVSYEWHFGHNEPNGQASTATGCKVTHKFLWAGNYYVVLTVTDNDGDQSVYRQQVTVVGSKPCEPEISGNVPW